MRSKPGKPDVDAFLAGVGGTTTSLMDTTKAVEEMAQHMPKTANIEQGRITKTIRITRDLDRRLKEEAFKRTMAGQRTTESDLIHEALNTYFNK